MTARADLINRYRNDPAFCCLVDMIAKAALEYRWQSSDLLDAVAVAEDKVKHERQNRSAYSIMWWGYLHQNGTIQVKRWLGDHADYTTDCYGNEFVQRVVPPFAANTQEEAIEILERELK